MILLVLFIIMNLFLFVKLVKGIFVLNVKKSIQCIMHNIFELYYITPQLNSDETNKFEKLKILKESIIESFESLKRSINKTIDDLNKYLKIWKMDEKEELIIQIFLFNQI